MKSLESLVELASFGTAGVSVLAIFLIGRSILKLPNDSPIWKVDLMKRYQNVCIIIAIICSLSGGANAYFNMGKIQNAVDGAETKVNAVIDLSNSGKITQIKKDSKRYRLSKADIEKYKMRIKKNPKDIEAQKKLLINRIATTNK